MHKHTHTNTHTTTTTTNHLAFTYPYRQVVLQRLVKVGRHTAELQGVGQTHGPQQKPDHLAPDLKALGTVEGQHWDERLHQDVFVGQQAGTVAAHQLQ